MNIKNKVPTGNFTQLAGKNAFVCGSTQGIGLATAAELARMGANVTLIARDAEKLKYVILPMSSARIDHHHDHIVADFSRPDELKATVQAYMERTKKTIHILVNNTGGPKGGLLENADISEFKAAFDMHIICSHLLMQAVKEGMKAAQYGRIINVISTSVKQPLDNLGVSNTIRGAMANWAKTLANELGKYGITVNNVLPGMTKTGRLDALLENQSQKSGSSIEAVEQQHLSTIPAQRFGEAEEIAAAIGFLASPAAAYINGINLPVDGGRTKCL